MPQDNLRLKIFKLVLMAVFLGSLVFNAELFWRLKSDIVSGYGDFIIFYTGAEILKAGLGDRLYDYETQKTFQDKFKVPIRVGPLPFNHPPFELLVFLPLTYLPYPIAYFVWSAINLALLAATFWLIVPFVDQQHKIIFGLMLAAFYPVLIAIVQGQDSILSVFLLTATFTNLKRQRDGIAGAMLGFGLFKPQLVLPMACILFFKRRWAAVTWFLIVSAFLGLLSLAIVGWNGAMQFVSLVVKINQQHYTIDPQNMPNVRGFFDTLLVGHSPNLNFSVVILMSFILLLWLLYFWRGDYRPNNAVFNSKFSLTIVITLLTSYHLYVHDLALLTVPAIFILNCALTNQAQADISRSIFLWLILLLWLPLTYIFLLANRQLSWISWLILILAAGLALEIFRSNRLQPQTSLARFR